MWIILILNFALIYWHGETVCRSWWSYDIWNSCKFGVLLNLYVPILNILDSALCKLFSVRRHTVILEIMSVTRHAFCSYPYIPFRLCFSHFIVNHYYKHHKLRKIFEVFRGWRFRLWSVVLWRVQSGRYFSTLRRNIFYFYFQCRKRKHTLHPN
jgi:hypothetical protein